MITVVTVVYRGGDALLRWAIALDSAMARAGQVEISVIAVDNASGDGTADRVRAVAPWARVLELDVNAGFAAGCNAGIALSHPDALIVLLNPDVAVHEDFFSVLTEVEWSDDLAAVGPQVRTPAGEVEQSARGFPSPMTALFGRTTLLSKLLPRSAMTRRQLLAQADAGPRVVDWVSGACLVAPGERFRRVGELDGGYWMYWEDADWCRRARALGLHVEYRPELLVVHHQGSSSASRPVRTAVAFHLSAARYYRLHVARSSLDAGVVRIALLARLAITLVAAVIRRALRRGPWSGDRCVSQ